MVVLWMEDFLGGEFWLNSLPCIFWFDVFGSAFTCLVVLWLFFDLVFFGDDFCLVGCCVVVV